MKRTFRTICEELGSFLNYFEEECNAMPMAIAEAIIIIHKLQEVKENLEWLESHNKQYTKAQYEKIVDTLELLEVPEV